MTGRGFDSRQLHRAGPYASWIVYIRMRIDIKSSKELSDGPGYHSPVIVNPSRKNGERGAIV